MAKSTAEETVAAATIQAPEAVESAAAPIAADHDAPFSSGDYLDETARRLRRVEERLERLLASGWRNAHQEAADLGDEAGALAEAGLERLAERLRAVAAARSAAQGLAAVTLALAGCRLLRARLAPGGPVPANGAGAAAVPAGAAAAGEWAPVGRERRGRSSRSAAPAAGADQVVPVGRMALAGGEAWACLRLRGSVPGEWVLVEPAALPEGVRALRTASGTEPAWLGTVLDGRLRWRARYPLGAAGSVERCVLEDAAPAAESDDNGQRTGQLRLVDHTRATLAKGWKAGTALLDGYGPVRLEQLDPADADAYLWADPAAAAALRECGTERVWAIVWNRGGSQAPLALLSPPGFLRKASLVHLVPGRPNSPLG
jgi:hypothetical protein